MNENSRLVLDENVHMCSGVRCPLRDDCYRFRLSSFFDVIARKAHRDPRFVEPAYSSAEGKCHWYIKPMMYTK